jgi:curli production assembly/transport component CsgF
MYRLGTAMRLHHQIDDVSPFLGMRIEKRELTETLTANGFGAEGGRLAEGLSPFSEGSGMLFARWSLAAVGLAGLMLASAAQAQDITYQPIDPTFGGNPFNSAHLLGVANAQNDYKDPKATTSNSQADIFARQLQSRLLSALSSQIVNAIFGENPQESGTIRFGGQTISFVRSLTEVTLTITDDDTGEVTTIVIPTFIDVQP